MTRSLEQETNQLVTSIKERRGVIDAVAQRLRTSEIFDAFDKWNTDSWCISVACDALVRLRLFTEQNFHFIETMGTIAVARYMFELSVWLYLFELDTRYGLVYFSQLLDTQFRYWKDCRAQLDREVALLNYIDKMEKNAQSEALERITKLTDSEKQKEALLTIPKAISDIVDKKAALRFSIYADQAKVNGYGYQAHLVKEKEIPQIDQSIDNIAAEKTIFYANVSQDVRDLIPRHWQWRQMAQKVELTDEYDYIYTFSSKLLHATPASITTDQKNLELYELLVFLKYINVKMIDLIELAQKYSPKDA